MEAYCKSVVVNVRNRLILLYYCKNDNLTKLVPKALKRCNGLINTSYSLSDTLIVLAKLLQELVKIYRTGKRIAEKRELDVSWSSLMRNITQCIESIVDIISVIWKDAINQYTKIATKGGPLSLDYTSNALNTYSMMFTVITAIKRIANQNEIQCSGSLITLEEIVQNVLQTEKISLKNLAKSIDAIIILFDFQSRLHLRNSFANSPDYDVGTVRLTNMFSMLWIYFDFIVSEFQQRYTHVNFWM